MPRHRSRNVVEFRLAPDDVSAIRFGISPGHELAHAVRVLGRPQYHPLQWGWLRRARGQVPGRAFELLRLLVGPDGYMPDFLTSTPGWDLGPDEEVARLREADLGPVRVDLLKRVDRTEGAEQRVLRALADDPERARALAADAWSQVWDAVLAPFWPPLERLLRADIGARSRRVTTHGLGAMVDTLHEAVTWAPDAVQVRLRLHGEELDCAGGGLVLVPSVMAPRCSVVTEPPAQPTLFYPALGISERWADDGPGTSGALVELLGAGRAGVLLALAGPLSTSEVAAAGGLAISTASHHLSLLRAARLVDSHREGPRVLHVRTPLGEALVGA
ncbi:ArsR/SmtB family transcription factor [Isoptericola sp. NPDC057191]|uniref:ArsR/SmtB family transcription factor n=1 Tax=Isoptericola sp. NPDC057191 TaxID=3346041 RepID=UPI00363A401D